MKTIAGNYNFIADQGATLERVFQWTDEDGVAVNITGYTISMSIKSGSTTLLSCTTANSRFALTTPTSGIFTLTVAAADMGFAAGVYQYDLFLTSGSGVVSRLLYGFFELREKIT